MPINALRLSIPFSVRDSETVAVLGGGNRGSIRWFQSSSGSRGLAILRFAPWVYLYYVVEPTKLIFLLAFLSL